MRKTPYKGIRFIKIYCGAIYESGKRKTIRRLFKIGKFSIWSIVYPKRRSDGEYHYYKSALKAIDENFNIRISFLDNNIIMYIALSKFDGSYVGRIESAYELLLKGLTYIQSKHDDPENEYANGEFKVLSACIGYNKKEQKWYGWSHRAIKGFGIGDKIKRGYIGYKPKDQEDFINCEREFWRSQSHSYPDYSLIIDEESKKSIGVKLTWQYHNDERCPNEKLRNTKSEMDIHFPNEWGKGEWTAKTLEDARQMAIDFAEEIQ